MAMQTLLTRASKHLENAHQELMQALTPSSAVEGLILLDIIGRLTTLKASVESLHNAIAIDGRENER